MVRLFLNYISLEKLYSKHTVQSYQKDLSQFTDFIEEVYQLGKHDEVTQVHIRDWVVSLVDKNLNSNSVNRKIATLKSFYKFLYHRGYVTYNPTKFIKPLKTQKKLPSFLKEKELEQIFEDTDLSEKSFAEHKNIYDRERLILELLYGTGMRLSELIGLQWADVNFYDSTLKVLGKRKKERIIPIGKKLLKALQSFHDELKKEGLYYPNVLVTDSGKPLYPMFIYRVVTKRLSNVSTLKKKSAHVLRHSFATILLNNGANLNAVKDLLGHSSLAATQVYTHNTIRKLKKSFNQSHPRA